MADVEIDTNVKDFTNRINFGIIVCTSGTRPNAVDGKAIYETDTDKLLIYNGATWAEITGGGVTDHGALTGLTDDDHTQYVLVNGTRAMTGDLTINKTNPYIYLKPTDASSPAVLLKDSADNIKGRMYTTGDDMVVRPDDGHLYLSTTVTTGGNVLLETKGVTRLTIADAGLTSTVPLAMGINKITGVVDPTADQEAATKKYVDDNAGISDHSLLSNLTWSTAGHTINTSIDMNNNSITDINELWFNTSDPGIKFDTGDFIWFDTSEDRIYFEIGSVNICYLRSTGIHPVLDDTYYLGSGSAYWAGLYADAVVVEDGTYMRGDGSGNMELHVATGKTVKIVVG